MQASDQSRSAGHYLRSVPGSANGGRGEKADLVFGCGAPPLLRWWVERRPTGLQLCFQNFTSTRTGTPRVAGSESGGDGRLRARVALRALPKTTTEEPWTGVYTTLIFNLRRNFVLQQTWREAQATNAPSGDDI